MKPGWPNCGLRSRDRPWCWALLWLASLFRRVPFAPWGGTQSRPPSLANELTRFGEGAWERVGGAISP